MFCYLFIHDEGAEESAFAPLCINIIHTLLERHGRKPGITPTAVCLRWVIRSVYANADMLVYTNSRGSKTTSREILKSSRHFYIGNRRT